MMKKNIINWYRISNLENVNFDYRLVEIVVPEFHNIQLERKNWKNSLIALSKEIQGPVGTIYVDGKKYAAIEANSASPEFEIPVIPCNAKIKSTDKIFHLDYANLNESNLNLAKEFLDFRIRKALSNNRELWKYSTSLYLHKKPVKTYERDGVDIYSGFNYKLHRDSKNFYIILDVTHKLISNQTVDELLSNGSLENEFIGRTAIYNNGYNQYKVKIRGFGVSIDQHQFQHNDGKTYDLLNYIKSNNSIDNNLINSNCKTLFYNYSNNDSDSYSGASCLTRLIITPANVRSRNI